MTTDAGTAGVPRFDVVLRGYDRRQVDEHVARLQRAITRMRSDLDIVRSQPLAQVERPTPHPRPGMPPTPPGSADAFSDRMQGILQKAEEEAAEIRNRARASVRGEEEQAKALRSQVADLTRQRDALLSELSRMREQRQGMLAAPTSVVPSAPTGASSGSPANAGPHGRTRDGAQGGSAPVPDSPGGRPPLPRPTPRPAGPGVSAPQRQGQPGPAAPAAAGGGRGPAQPGGPNGAPQGGAPRPPTGPVRPPAAPQGARPPAAQQPGQPQPPQGPQQHPQGQQQPPQGQQQPPQGQPRPGDLAAKQGSHRLPSGGYPPVADEASSLRPRGGPEPEVSELFRPMDPARQEAVARQNGQNGQNGRPDGQRPAPGNQPEQRTAMVRAQEPRGSAPARPATGPAGGPESTRKVDAAGQKPGQQPGPGQNGGPGRGGPGQNGHGAAGNGNGQNGNHNGQNGHKGQGGNGQGGNGRPPRSSEATVLTSAKPGEGQNDGNSAGRSPSGSRKG
jgi:syndecan 1